MANGLDFEKPILELELKIAELKSLAADGSIDLSDEIKTLENRLEKVRKEVFETLTPWQKVQIARHPKRPYTADYINMIMVDFTELHGDRMFYDDKAMIGGFARIDNEKVLVMGHQKGRDTKENLMRNFGSAHPEGYRKAMRLMELAEKFNVPIVAFVDTPGAYPGIGAEERGQANSIAHNLREMISLKVPIIVIVIGEGGSGGALGIGIGDRVYVLENAYYSVISPEGCAAILWKDRLKAPEAAEVLKLTAKDLIGLGIIDGEISEPLGG
ncbi:MAG: acetyl-CoA carboxylase carboxyltransferase subunit alpha, partial [Candidatus Omnitrophica bacterium]|nr:acetyl-CoA carboxylase carboxyltransferase subunit alpha [Candidatus Omnitrophota bacterium]